MINSAIFVLSIMACLVADSSPVWCAVFALMASGCFALQKLLEVIGHDVRVEKAKRTGSAGTETDSEWVRHVEVAPSPYDDTSIWEEYQ